MSDIAFVTRFAPSPTGLLHRGHAFSALTAWTAARVVGGRFLLRIEDTDFTRCRPQFEANIVEDLTWLGLDWDGPVRRQSDHRSDYDSALDSLKTMGVLYRCFRTRKELLALAGIAPHTDDPRDDRAFVGGPISAQEEAKRLDRGEPYAWRLSLAAARERLGDLSALTWTEEAVEAGDEPVVVQAHPERLGDMVLGRKDIGAGYVIASVVDDAAQAVTHVIRGEDLAPTTSVQRILQALLDLPVPTHRHHRLLLGPDGKRYAKRDGAVTLAALRAGGMTAATLRAELGFPDR